MQNCSQIIKKTHDLEKNGLEIKSSSWFWKIDRVFKTYSGIWKNVHEILENVHKNSKKSRILNFVPKFKKIIDSKNVCWVKNVHEFKNCSCVSKMIY